MQFPVNLGEYATGPGSRLKDRNRAFYNRRKKYDSLGRTPGKRTDCPGNKNEDEIKEMVNNGKATFYIGFDPTADSLHVGHFMALCLMESVFRWQETVPSHFLAAEPE